MQRGATAQFEAGRGAAQDPLQAEAELAHMEHDSAILAAERDILIAQLNELLHRDPESPLPPPPAELDLRPLPDVSSAKALQAQALRGRTEIAAAREHARAEQARAEQAGRETYPDFTLMTSYNSMWDMPEHRWMVGMSFNLPLQFERRAGASEEADAARAQYESEVLRLSDMAKSEVYVALRRLKESEHVLTIFEKRLIPVARDQIEAARSGFIASQTPFMAVVGAEKNLRSVELDYQNARAEYDRRRAELDRSIGRIPGLDEAEVKP
jgi:outer membrane protein TolC